MEFTLSEHAACDVCPMHTPDILGHTAQDQFSVLLVLAILAKRNWKFFWKRATNRRPEFSAFYF